MKCPFLLCVLLLSLLVSSIAENPVGHRSQSPPACRCFPGDTCWPTKASWTAFNQSLGGKLIATIPVASPCHDDPYIPYDARQCSQLRSSWFLSETHFDTSSSVMAPYFTNNSCNPFSTEERFLYARELYILCCECFR